METFTWMAEGVYIGPQERSNILTVPNDDAPDESGFYLITRKQDRYYFDDSGTLRYIADINQNKTSFDYDDNRKLLTKVSNVCGSLSFSYNDDGLLTTVSDHTGRNATFEYEKNS